MYYLNNFFLFSILGHLFESIIFVAFNLRKESGFLNFWWTPIYGIGLILGIFFYRLADKFFRDEKIRNVVLFLVYMFVFTVTEFLGGTILEKIYGYSFWDYTGVPLHFGKYISVWTSLLWTGLAFIYIYWIKKYSDKLVRKIPKFLTWLLVLGFVFDLISTFAKL